MENDTDPVTDRLKSERGQSNLPTSDRPKEYFSVR